MSKGKRYESEPKLNITKVFAVVILIAVIIMFIFIIKGLFTKDTTTGKITSKSYFSSYKNDRWGVIDETGNNIIDEAYKEMIIIPNSKMGVFICTYDVNYETGEYKTKVLNEKNKEIFTEYEIVQPIQNIDKDENLKYDQSVLKVKKDGKYGLIDYSGKTVIPSEYEEITAISKVENSFKVKKNGKYGIVDSEGKTVIKPQYENIDVLGENNKTGFIVKDENGKYGVVDYSNAQMLGFEYDGIEKIHVNDLYVVVIDGKQKLVNVLGEEILEEGFDSIKQILVAKEKGIIYIKDNKYGVMNTSGETLINAEYDYLREAKSGIFIAKKEDKYGIIDINNEEKVPFMYALISYNEKADIYVIEDNDFNANILNSNLERKLFGMLIELNENKGYIKLKIEDEYKYYNFKFEEKEEVDIYANRTLFLDKKDGKFGYVDKNGKIIVDYIYDDATEQNDYGYVAVKKDGKWGSIDAKGNVVQEPIYNLDEYLLINFVGRWHYGKDLNMNYYNQL